MAFGVTNHWKVRKRSKKRLLGRRSISSRGFQREKKKTKERRRRRSNAGAKGRKHRQAVLQLFLSASGHLQDPDFDAKTHLGGLMWECTSLQREMPLFFCFTSFKLGISIARTRAHPLFLFLPCNLVSALYFSLKLIPLLAMLIRVHQPRRLVALKLLSLTSQPPCPSPVFLQVYAGHRGHPLQHIATYCPIFTHSKSIVKRQVCRKGLLNRYRLEL